MTATHQRQTSGGSLCMSLTLEEKDISIANSIFDKAMANSLQESQYQECSVDKLSLVKAYETILRSQGILPVSDSRVYDLVFKVYNKCEGVLQHINNRQDVQCQLQQSLISEASKQDSDMRAGAFDEFRLKRRTLRMMRKVARDKENKKPGVSYISSHGGKARKQKDTQINMPAQKTNRSISKSSIPTVTDISFTSQQDQSFPQIEQSFRYLKAQFSNRRDKPLSQPDTSYINTSQSHTQSNQSIIMAQEKQYERQAYQERNFLGERPSHQPVQKLDRSAVSQISKHRVSESQISAAQMVAKSREHSRDISRDLSYVNTSGFNDISYFTQKPHFIDTTLNETFVRAGIPQSTKNLYENMPLNDIYPTNKQVAAFQNAVYNANGYSTNGNSTLATYINGLNTNSSIKGLYQRDKISQSFVHPHPLRIDYSSTKQSTQTKNCFQSKIKNQLHMESVLNFSMEDNYRLLVKYMKLWHSYVRKTKQKRRDKKNLVKKIAKAINFHEQQLLTKTLLSFIKNRVWRAQLMINAVRVIGRVQFNQRKFYLQVLRRQYKEAIWLKSGMHVAQLYRFKTLRRNSFRYLRAQVFKQRIARQQMQQRVYCKPRAMYYALSFIACMCFGKNDLKQLPKYVNSRLKQSQRQELKFSIQWALITQMRAVYKAWKQHTDKVVALKAKVLMRKVRLCLQKFKHWRDTCVKARNFLAVVKSKTKFLVMYGFRINADFYINLRVKQHQISLRHKTTVCRGIFENWHGLFSQYTHLMRESTMKTKASNSAFIRRYFEAILKYAMKRKYRAAQYGLALQFYYERNSSSCFMAWRESTYINKRLKRAERRIRKSNNLKLKDEYLKQWINRVYYNEITRRIRRNRLMRKVFSSFRRNISYKIIRTEIKRISTHQYYRSLMMKSIRSIQEVIQKKRKLELIRHAKLRINGEEIIKRVFQAIFAYKTEVQTQRIQKQLAAIFRSNSLHLKSFKKLREGTLKSKVLRQHEMILRSYIDKKLMFKTLQRMAQKIDKKQRLRFHQYQLQRELLFKGVQKCFYIMLNKYQSLVHREQLLSHITAKREAQKIISQWYQYTSEVSSYKIRIGRFLGKKRQGSLKEIFKAWTQFTGEVVLARKYRQVATYFFLQKYMKTIIRKLRSNAETKKMIRQALENLKKHWLKTRFLAMKKVCLEKKSKRKAFISYAQTVLSKSFERWVKYTSQRFRLRAMLSECLQRRDLIKCQRVISVLSQLRKEKNQQRELRLREMLQSKLRKVLNCLQRHSENVSLIRELSSQTQKKAELRVIRQSLKTWQKQMRAKVIEREVIVPFYQQQELSRLISAFSALREYSQSKSLRYRKLDNILRKKSLKKLQWSFLVFSRYHMQKVKTSLIVQKVRAITSHQVVQLAFESLLQSKLARRRLRELKNELEKRSPIWTKRMYMNLWLERQAKWMKLKPLLRQADELYNYLLVKKSLNSLQQYVVCQRRKKEMILSLAVYRQELTLTKGFKGWKAHHQIHQRLSEIHLRIQLRLKQDMVDTWKEAFVASLKQRRKQDLQKRFITLRTKSQARVNTKILKAFNKNVRMMRKLKKGLQAVVEALETVSKRKSFSELQLNLRDERKMDNAADFNDRQRKKQALLQIRVYVKQQRVKSSQGAQAKAFFRLSYLRRTVLSLYLHKEEKRQLRHSYSRMSRVYKNQLKQKAWMVMQWNSMRARYQRGLIDKSLVTNDLRLKRTLFRSLKKLLIRKYASAHIEQKKEFSILSDYLNCWRAAYYESLSAGENQTNLYGVDYHDLK